MAKETRLRKGNLDDETPERSFPTGMEEDLAATLSAREFQERLREYVEKKCEANSASGLIEGCVSDGVLIIALKMIGERGPYAMDEGRFWQILEQNFPFQPSGSSPPTRSSLLDEVESQFAAARNESFEGGFDSAFSFELVRLVLKHGDTSIRIISDVVLGEGVAPDVAAEALRCLGEMRNEATHDARRALLEHSLECSSHIVRDGAVLGLSDLSDPRTIPSLERAAAREQYKLLRANMVDLLERLKGIGQ